jgi:hypothetical protein
MGNSGSDEIYHDRNQKRSITYRTNLARLMDKLIEEGKVNKSKSYRPCHDKNASRQVH